MLPKFSVSHLLIAAMPLAWLVPLHRQPWAAARSDAWAMACLLAAALLAAQPGRLPRPWAAFGVLALGTVALQAASGHIFFGGDALLAATYLLAFMLAVALGAGLVQTQAHTVAPPGHTGVFVLSGAVVVCAVVSVGMALAQWTGLATDIDSPWLLPMGEHGRAFANMAQPNHFSTLCFLGLCSLALLRQGRAFGAGIFWPVAAWLLLGMVMSDSRTGAVQLVVMLLLVLLLSRRTGQSVPPLGLVLLLAAHGVGLAWWSQLGGGLQLAQASVRATVLEGGGSRWRHWASMWDAIVQQPWWGYGWQQVSVAQVRVADRWPVLGEQLSSSHNIALDLLLWNGIPVGATLLALALWWLVSRLWRCRDAVSMWLLVGVAGLAVHGLLEWPLEYAYFLVPLGLWIGAIEALQPARARAPGPTPALRLPPWATRGLALLLAAVLAAIGADYLPAERFNRHLQLALASPGASYTGPPPPTLRVLSQLAARQRFQIVVAQPGLPDAEVDGLRKVAERYAYAPVMFRYAQTAALNGRAAEATLTLVRLCRIHPAALCDEAGEAWRVWQQRYPQLATVPGPDAASSAPGGAEEKERRERPGSFTSPPCRLALSPVRRGGALVRRALRLCGLVRRGACGSNRFPMKKAIAPPPRRAVKSAAKPRPAARPARGAARAPARAAAPTPTPAVAIGARLRHARLLKGLLIKDLAARVGVSISLISKYENNKLLPPLTVLHALVTALETNIGALFDADWTGVDHVTRAGSRPRIAAAGDGDAAGVTLERLVPNGRGHLLQGNIHIVAPGGGSMGPMRHEGDEVGYVLQGRLELSIGEVNYELGPGDSFAFPSNLAHTYRNPGAVETRVLWINTPPTF